MVGLADNRFGSYRRINFLEQQKEITNHIKVEKEKASP